MRHSKALLAALLGLGLAGALGRADVVELREGGAPLDGQVLSEKCPACGGSGQSADQAPCKACQGLGTAEARVRIRLRAGLVEIPRAQVKRIIWRPVDQRELLGPAEYYRLAAAKLDQADAAGNLELGRWCLKAGLLEAARRHLAAAVALDGKLADSAAPLLAELARRTEESAVKALLGALAALPRQSPAEAAAALRGFQKTWAETEIARREELQRDLVRKQFPELAAQGTVTVEALARAAEDRVASLCERCAGSGRANCPLCQGLGAGPCPGCKGTGKAVCPVCQGTARLTCPQCFGTGRTRGGLVMGYNMERFCPACNGQGEVLCDVCAATGKRPCKRCKGTGHAAGSCPACGGKGSGTCAACGGSGFKAVERFVWGPPPVRQPGMVNVVAPGNRVRAWQGELAGGIITVVPADALHRGALSRLVELAAGGRKFRVLGVALDNRKGAKTLRLRAADKTLRAVTGSGGQLEMADLAKALAGAAGKSQAGLIAEQAGDVDCLPGAYQCVLAALGEGADLDDLSALFWMPIGNAEPAKLAPIWLTDEEVAELRRSLREK